MHHCGRIPLDGDGGNGGNSSKTKSTAWGPLRLATINVYELDTGSIPGAMDIAAIFGDRFSLRALRVILLAGNIAVMATMLRQSLSFFSFGFYTLHLLSNCGERKISVCVYLRSGCRPYSCRVATHLYALLFSDLYFVFFNNCVSIIASTLAIILRPHNICVCHLI